MTSRYAWKKRATRHGESISGVLFEGLPDYMNELIHEWHIEIICKHVLPHIPKNGLVLDLGCGYGRVAESIKKYRQDARIVGLDYVRDYCDHFNRSGSGSAICGDMAKLPFRSGQFDCILAITSLMYVDTDRVGHVINGIYDLVKKNGLILFMDPSREFIDIIRAFRRSKASTGDTTGGSGFYKHEYHGLVSQAVVGYTASGGNMGFTLMVPALLMVGRTPIRFIAGKFSKIMDRIFGRIDKYAIHRWIVVRRL